MQFCSALLERAGLLASQTVLGCGCLSAHPEVVGDTLQSHALPFLAVGH